MGLTIIEKIVRDHIGKEAHPGEIVTVNVDRVMIHDIFIPFVASKFEEMGFTKSSSIGMQTRLCSSMTIWCQQVRWTIPDISA